MIGQAPYRATRFIPGPKNRILSEPADLRRFG